MSIKLDIDCFNTRKGKGKDDRDFNKSKLNDSDFELKSSLYGKRLEKVTYFSLYKGLLSPKICEKVAYNKNVKLSPYLKDPLEPKYLNFNAQLNIRAAENIEGKEPEVAKEQSSENGKPNGNISQI